MDQCTHEVRAEYWKRIIQACGQRPAGQSAKSEYSVRIMQLFRTFSAGHPEIRCSDSGCQCSPL